MGITKATAHLIVTACNACQKVNPDNPQAVAESIEKAFEALKDCLALLDKQRDEYNSAVSILPRPSVGEGDIAKKARQALQAAEGKGAS